MTKQSKWDFCVEAAFGRHSLTVYYSLIGGWPYYYHAGRLIKSKYSLQALSKRPSFESRKK